MLWLDRCEARNSTETGWTEYIPFGDIWNGDDGADCGYPESVQRADGQIVTAWYSNNSPLHIGYHLGVTIWKAPELKGKSIQ